MQSRLILFTLFSVFCLQAVFAAQNPLYNLSDKRYLELLSRLNQAQFADQKTSLLTIAANTLGFNCTQARGLIASYSTDGDRLNALTILKNNIVDVTNKQKQIIETFERPEDRQKATEILNNIVAAKVVPHPNDPFPAIDLPFTNKWNADDLADLIKVINAVPNPKYKVKVAEAAVLGHPEVLSPDQAMTLFGAFSSYKDIILLKTLIKDKTVGITCQHLTMLLHRFSLSSQKTELLNNLECSFNSSCGFNNDLYGLAEFIHINLMGSNCSAPSQVADSFTFEEQKYEILEGFSDFVIDIENKLSILGAFNFPSTKERARKILDTFKGNSHIFGSPSGKVYFIIDISGSMSATFKVNGTQTMSRLDFVKREFTRVVSGFNESTAFNALAFSDKVTVWSNNLVNATQANIKSSIEFCNKFTANGGTNSYDALKTAFNTPGVESIYFLSDGTPTQGPKTSADGIIADVKQWNSNGKIKVHSIAMLAGTYSNDDKVLAKKFMKNLSDATGGYFRALESDS